MLLTLSRLTTRSHAFYRSRTNIQPRTNFVYRNVRWPVTLEAVDVHRPNSSRRLLIVDDDLLSREVLAIIAAEAGFEVGIHHSGEDVIRSLSAASSLPPAAILADMQMPGISGDLLAHALRPLCPASTLLIAMSGSPVPVTDRGCFDAFLLKPFSIGALIEALETSSSVASSSAVPAQVD